MCGIAMVTSTSAPCGISDSVMRRNARFRSTLKYAVNFAPLLLLTESKDDRLLERKPQPVPSLLHRSCLLPSQPSCRVPVKHFTPHLMGCCCATRPHPTVLSVEKVLNSFVAAAQSLTVPGFSWPGLEDTPAPGLEATTKGTLCGSGKDPGRPAKNRAKGSWAPTCVRDCPRNVTGKKAVDPKRSRRIVPC